LDDLEDLLLRQTIFTADADDKVAFGQSHNFSG
jgi:hypothetical protein